MINKNSLNDIKKYFKTTKITYNKFLILMLVAKDYNLLKLQFKIYGNFKERFLK